ncbi:N-acetylglucosamine-6-phosphate deacetylase [Calothrix sp. NIES-3974]|uniref:N-acetylglucosamine-6-phosphate deacetylase n=1 Tax=Calothrix sp. NIES-3974 TaxID=2005462 RepID=UPI000B5F9E57|nr:N-acetylglucosamine-6-phosphate deacetylase [Calothrix sp. NIES-3974]BAZ04770.1 N-acetyl-glucosamine-6-phosphate deacetylase [Calothrix sp. NIES-3974]
MSTNLISLINARIPGKNGLYRLLIDKCGLLVDVSEVSVEIDSHIIDANTIDLAGDWISSGGVDLQINGGLGLAFPDLTADNAYMCANICKYLWSCGVDGFTPTLVTTSVEKIQSTLAVIAAYMDHATSDGDQESAQILGVHLEGPFLNPQKRGAHPEEYLLPLTQANIQRVLGDYAHIVKIMTLAPEMDETGDAIAYLRSLGITVSLGHSLATAEQAMTAFDQGATMVTHAFNAMPSLHHRQPGLLAAAITHPQVMCGFIADGEHVVPMMVDVLLRASNYQGGLFLVSDALAPLGLGDGIYPWDERQIEVKNGTARLLDGTLSGTTLPLLVGVENLVKWGICSPEQAILMATVAPRRAIGLPEMVINHISAHNLLRWHYDADTQEISWQRLVRNLSV